MARTDGRPSGQLRPVTFTRRWLDHAEGSVLVEFGRTKVLCAASVTQGVPRWRKGGGLGWVTAEYAMLPRSTNTRSDRESVKGRIGARTPAITGAYVALVDAVGHLRRAGALAGEPLTGSVAAVSVGIVDREPMLDLCYEEDVRAETDMNVVM